MNASSTSKDCYVTIYRIQFLFFGLHTLSNIHYLKMFSPLSKLQLLRSHLKGTDGGHKYRSTFADLLLKGASAKPVLLVGLASKSVLWNKHSGFPDYQKVLLQVCNLRNLAKMAPTFYSC